jgi:hypothetical protein
MTIRFRALEKRIDAVLSATARHRSARATGLILINGQLSDAQLEAIASDPTSQADAEMMEILRDLNGKTRGLPEKGVDRYLERRSARGHCKARVAHHQPDRPPEPAATASAAAAPGME